MFLNIVIGLIEQFIKFNKFTDNIFILTFFEGTLPVFIHSTIHIMKILHSIFPGDLPVRAGGRVLYTVSAGV